MTSTDTEPVVLAAAAMTTALMLWISKKAACMPKRKCVFIFTTCGALDNTQRGIRSLFRYVPRGMKAELSI